MTQDMIFEMAANAAKAKAFDHLAYAMAQLEVENKKLRKVVEVWMQDCDWCEGSGEKSRVVSQGGNEEIVKECCDNCSGTGKIPK